MPAKSPEISVTTYDRLIALGQQIRDQRKAMHISATVVAEAAGISRVTLHRIENGKPSVTMGAYLNAMAALDMDFGIIQPEASSATPPADDHSEMIPVRIRLDDYPQLRKLAWQVHGIDTLTPLEALSIYERNWRHVDEKALESDEQQLIKALRLGLGDGNANI
jgi:transcriptional regulator with XRE-family HTH domain